LCSDHACSNNKLTKLCHKHKNLHKKLQRIPKKKGAVHKKLHRISKKKKMLASGRPHRLVSHTSISCASYVSRAHIVRAHRLARVLCSHMGTALLPARTWRPPAPLLRIEHAGILPVPAPAASHARFTREPHGALAATADGSDRWVPLQHMQHPIYFCNIQVKHLQHMSETLVKRLKTLESRCKHMQHPDKTLATYA
jgi:hypothetical protein